VTRPRRRRASQLGIVLAAACVLLVDWARSVLSAVAHRAIRLAERGIILAAACILLVAESVLSAVGHRTIKPTELVIVLAAPCILLVAMVRLAAGSPLWSDRLSPGIPGIPALSAPASPMGAALAAPSCPTIEGCSQQSPDGRKPASGTAAVPAPLAAVPAATPTPPPAVSTVPPALPTAAPTATPTPVTPTVFIDPGHGGVDLGAVGVAADGSFVYEKDAALALALRTADHLRADGINVVLSRTDDSLTDATRSDYRTDGLALTSAGLRADLHRRIDRANASGAQLLLSIHFNGLDDPSVAGTTTIYCGSRPFADKNRHFATLIQDTVIATLRAEGYTTPDQGVIDDEDYWAPSFVTLQESSNHLVLLGPAVPGKPRPSNMPGVIFETFYLSNLPEASAAMQPDTQDLIASALAKAVGQYLRDERLLVASAATAGLR
jgi:N-acetylmuramoyl-L-alanine amidase